MTSPTRDGRLFFSSSPTRYTSDPAEEVEVVLAEAQKVDRLDPSIDAIISANRSAFFGTLSRRVELIKSRSQAFQDCHVTIFDKVLLILTDNGRELNNTAAISHFCEDHLGIPRNPALAQKGAILLDALIAPATPTQAISPPETRRGSLFTRDASSDSPVKKCSLFESDAAHNPAVLAVLAAQVGGPMVRLWGVYDKAKKDFFAVTDPSSLRKQETAKFLRDTAENLLHYLRDKSVDQRLLDELSMTFETAKHTAMTLHGGKKRKFDRPAPAALSEISADNFNRSWQDSAQTRRLRPDPVDTARVNARSDKRLRATEDIAENYGYPGYIRALADYGRRSVRSELHQDQRRFLAPEISPKNARMPKQKKKLAGRGHSGIPYGYTRPVDSYYPV